MQSKIRSDKSLIKISDVRKASDKEWDFAWKRCPYATFFHSREWAEIWRRYGKNSLSPAPLRIGFSDGSSIILPFLKKRSHRGLVSSLVSSAAGTYGGWISADELSVNHERLAFEYLSRANSLVWRVNPFTQGAWNYPAEIERTESARNKRLSISDDNTHVIDLSKSFDIILSGWTKNNLRAARRALKLGIEVRKVSDKAEWPAYYDIYRKALERWGDKKTAQYRWELFDIMRSLKSENIMLRLAYLKDRPIAGILCLKSKQHVAVWHAATITDCLYLRPFNLLVYAEIADALRNGFKWFDLNPSGGHAGVVLSKERLGCERMPCPQIEIKSRQAYLIERFAESLSLAKSAWMGGIRNGRL